jgi:hypothetical protein
MSDRDKPCPYAVTVRKERREVPLPRWERTKERVIKINPAR